MAPVEITIENTYDPNSDIGKKNLFFSISGQNNGNYFWYTEDAGVRDNMYFPVNPSANNSNLTQNVGIFVGAGGQKKTITLNEGITGGRIWVSLDQPVIFKINPTPTGPSPVFPSILNASDPNNNIDWDFCELTIDSTQLFANLSYVDFVAMPIALQLQGSKTMTVAGLKPDAIAQIRAGLTSAGSDWAQLIQSDSRILSPNSAISAGKPDLFKDYWTAYLDMVYNMAKTTPIQMDTLDFGVAQGRAAPNDTIEFTLGDGEKISYERPSAQAIFDCATHPFENGGSRARQQLTPRICAALNRATIQLPQENPNAIPQDQYYNGSVYNVYSQLVHASNFDGKGYSFPYDDVHGASQPDVSASVMDPQPKSLSVFVGGGDKAKALAQQEASEPAK